jgi:hypothetical protein
VKELDPLVPYPDVYMPVLKLIYSRMAFVGLLWTSKTSRAMFILLYVLEAALDGVVM